MSSQYAFSLFSIALFFLAIILKKFYDIIFQTAHLFSSYIHPTTFHIFLSPSIYLYLSIIFYVTVYDKL